MGFGIQAVDRLGTGHKQPVTFGPAKAQVRHTFRGVDRPYLVAIGRKYLYAVFLLTGPTCAAPNIAVDIDAESVWYGAAKVTKNPVIGKRLEPATSKA